MLRVAIVGATGYAGEELLKILVNHAQVKITSVSAKITKPQKIGQIYPSLKGRIDLICAAPDFTQIVPACELAFLALPHRVSMQVAPKFLRAKKRIIDLSADYRLKDAALYEKWYDAGHQSPGYLAQAVYGLPELNRRKIKQARLLANPGCFPTGIILACLPLLARKIAQAKGIIADAKTGLSGAGREKERRLAVQMQENFRAYKVDAHQHSPEINQELSNFAKKDIAIVLVPHLIPIKRGILSTVYLRLEQKISQKNILQAYQEFYRREPFVKILPEGEFPELKKVLNTNFCHIGLKVNLAQKLAVVICAIDNLMKGAAGQAVQNMNIMCGFKETAGLR